MSKNNKGRTLICGDIHGNYEALKQVLERCGFDYEEDTLISIGDVVDGHSQSYEVVEELLKIKNLIAVKGNHDDWFNEWLKTGKNPSNWQQGQKATGLSYLENSRPGKDWLSFNHELSGMEESIKVSDIPESHIDFFKNQLDYFIDDNNNLFVHGGFNRHERLEEQGSNLWWDRDLWNQALSYESMGDLNYPGHAKGYKPKFKMLEEYNEIFIGHTSTQFWGKDVPMKAANIWNVDTGAGWIGKLTIMDINTKEFWQSNNSKELYPEFKGR